MTTSKTEYDTGAVTVQEKQDTGGSTSTVIIKLFKDGSVMLNPGICDICIGIRTILARVAADELGVDPSVIQVENTGAAISRNSLPGGGRKFLPPLARTVRQAAASLKQDLLAVASDDLEVEEDELQYIGDEIIWTRNSRIRVKITEVSRLHKHGMMIGIGYHGTNPADRISQFLAPPPVEWKSTPLPGRPKHPGRIWRMIPTEL